jgi:hypothetical protein
MLIAMAPMTALADNPGNPGHHYGQISNPGHHYGQLKHPKTPPPGTQPSAPPALPSAGGSFAGNTTIVATVPTTNSGSPLIDGPIASQVPAPIESPAPLPVRNLWLTAILLALVLAANVVGGVVVVGRALHFALRRVRPVAIAVPSPGNLQVKTA